MSSGSGGPKKVRIGSKLMKVPLPCQGTPVWDEESGGLTYTKPAAQSPMEVKVIRVLQTIIKDRRAAGRPTSFRNVLGHLSQAQYAAERNWLFNQFPHKDLCPQFMVSRPEYFTIEEESGEVLVARDLTIRQPSGPRGKVQLTDSKE